MRIWRKGEYSFQIIGLLMQFNDEFSENVHWRLLIESGYQLFLHRVEMRTCILTAAGEKA